MLTIVSVKIVNVLKGELAATKLVEGECGESEDNDRDPESSSCSPSSADGASHDAADRQPYQRQNNQE